MGVFDSKPLNTTSLNNTLRKSPLLFGVPFVMIMVVASYALVPFTQTKYELQDRRISKVRLKPAFCHLNSHLRGIFRSRRNRSSAWRTERESLTSARSTLQVSFHAHSPRSLRFTFRLPPETQREGHRRLGAQAYRTSGWNTGMGRTTV